MSLWSPLKNRLSRRRFTLQSITLPNLLLIGFVLRLVLAPFSSDPNDVGVFYIVANDLLAGLNVYTTNSFSYPPLWAYIIHPALALASFSLSPNLLGVRVDTLSLSIESWKLPPIITSPFFNILVKLPLIIADVLIGIILYSIVKELIDEKRAKMTFILWFFNPLVIFIDSIHGQFDVIPTLMTVLAFCLLCNRKYFSSGIAIGIGVMLKIFPIYLTPLYLFSIAKLETSESSRTPRNLRKALAHCSTFFVGILAPAAIFSLPLINSNMIHDVFARTESITSVGGLTIFSIVQIPGMEWLLQLISSNSGLVFISLTLVSLILIMFISFACFSKQKDFLRAFLSGHIAILLAIYVTSLLVNPQHILWILPFLILSWGLYRQNLNKIKVLSVSASTFLIGFGGPLFFFYPLAAFTPLLSVGTVYSTVSFFEQYAGWIILLISGVLGVSAIILCLWETMGFILEKEKRAEMSDDPSQERRVNDSTSSLRIHWHVVNPSKVLALMFVALLVAQLLVFALPLIPQNVDFQVLDLSHTGEGYFRINYEVKSARYPVDIEVSAVPLTSMSNRSVDKTIFIYYDQNYPSSLVSEASWIGLLDHIPIELKLRGYNAPIIVVDTEKLKDEALNNKDCVIVIPSGVLPDTVHANNVSLIGNWIRSGGTLIWIGDAFGYFSGSKGKSVQLFSADNFSEVQTQVLGYDLFNGTSEESERFATASSNFSKALDLRYPDAEVGAYVSEVLKNGGEVLGKITASENARASIAYVPVGKGHLLLFGGGVGRVFAATGEDVIAHDIAQILCSGFPFSTGIVTSNLHELERSEVKQASLDMLLPRDQNVTGIMIVVFSKSPYNRYFSRQFRPIDGS